MRGPPATSLPPLACPRCGAAVLADEGGVRCPACGAAYPERDGILHLTAGREGAPGYDPHYFSTLPQVEEDHFWFVTRRRLILDSLQRSMHDRDRQPLFDIGCGAGGLLAFLERGGIEVTGACDAYLEGLRLARSRVQAPLVLVDEGSPPPLAPGHSAIGLFDVLEHVDDDVGLLLSLASVLRPGGVVVLTVPAHGFLFDEMDELARHRRRYGARELGTKLRAAGLEVVRLSHFMATLMPLLVVTRWLGRTLGRRHSARARRDLELSVVPGVNAFLRFLLGWERLWLRLAPLPFGSSLIAVARKPGYHHAPPDARSEEMERRE